MKKKALVTGASEGIGRAFARMLTEAGYEVTAVARNEARLKELDARAVVADLTDASDLSRVCDLLRSEKFDLLVNNAGLGVFGPFHQLESKDIRRMIDLNCTALVELSSAFLKGAVKGDALINVSSGVSFLPYPLSSVYTGTKGFVTTFSESLWFESRKRGVYVMALCPGGTYSEFHGRAGGKTTDLPDFIMQTPEQVVSLALKHLRKRRAPVVISGPQAPVIFLCRFLPRKLVTLIAGHAVTPKPNRKVLT